MMLRHATPRCNLASIRRTGVDPARSQGRLRACWWHEADATPWAVLHTIRRHGGRVEDVVVIEVDVPERWLRRHASGLWYCLESVKIPRRVRVIRFEELSASPVSSISEV